MNFFDFCLASTLPAYSDFLLLKKHKVLNLAYLKDPKPLKGQTRSFFKRLKSLDLEELKKDFKRAKKFTLLRVDQKQFPPLLKEIPDPPVYLFVWGKPEVLKAKALSFVGTRKATSYGKKITFNLVLNLRFPWVIVSGLAVGIDGFSHQAALDAGLKTVAVLGSGFFNLYPPTHRKLAEKIAKQGALVSEYPPQLGPEKYYFVARNRIIAGLSLATVVVEAAEKSGALITASYAAKYGREVMAVGGDIFRLTSKGCFSLMRQGAKPIFSAEDIEEEFENLFLRHIGKTKKKEGILLFLAQPRHTEEIQEYLSCSSEEVSIKLAQLEVEGKIKNLGSGFYQAL